AVGRNCAFFVLSAKAGGTIIVSNRQKVFRGCPMIRMMLAVLVRMMIVVIALAAGPVAHAGALQPPEGRKIRVAVVMTEGAVVIDSAGPWEAFETVHTGAGDMDRQMPSELDTVARGR